MKLRQRRLTAVLVSCTSLVSILLGAVLILGSVEAAFAQVDRAVLEGQLRANRTYDDPPCSATELIWTIRRANESARAVNAEAYTVGRNVVFAANRYAPETTPGRQLLVPSGL